MTQNRKAKISIVVPVYKEENNIRPFLKRLEPVLERVGFYEILFCLDPSPDNTEQIIKKEIDRNKRIGLIVFSRRFGQPAATIAGIMNSKGQACVVIDVDLQDPPELIPLLYSKLQEGYDVVYAKRKSRKGESGIKLLVSSFGYRMINAMSNCEIPPDTGDFRIISRKVVEEIRKLKETHGFLRGLVALVGFRQTYVEYEREERYSGQGKYNRYFGSLKIGLNGLICFSSMPLTVVLITGLVCTVASFTAFLILLASISMWDNVWMPCFLIGICAVFFVGSSLMTAIGLLGEYIGRIYDEVKVRPMYIVDRRYNTDENDSA